MEKLKLSDFDLLGMIELENVAGIEDLVTPTGDGKFVSRSSIFWRPYTCTEASEFREQLKTILPFISEKRAFVALDYMCNLSGKVYYEQVLRSLDRPDKAKIDRAKDCLMEDVGNVIRLFEGKSLKINKNPNSKLPIGDDIVPRRNIECNNLALLYVFTKSFKVPEGYNVLNTGLGGVFIGPFFYNIHGTQWTNMIKSKYSTERNPSEPYNFMHSIVKPETFSNKNILLLDDNVGTGDTIKEVKLKLNEHGFNVKTGAVQYNWLNFYRVGIGEKNINRFDPMAIDYITYFNYPGHKLIDHSIGILCGQRNLNGIITQDNPYDGMPFGECYRQYKEVKHYFLKDSGIATLREKGTRYSNKSGFPLSMDFNNKRTFSPFIRASSIQLMERLDNTIATSVLNSSSPGEFGEH